MAKVICPCAECIHNDNSICKCKKVIFSWSSMLALHEGRVEVWRCKQYEQNEMSKEFEKLIKKVTEQEKNRRDYG